MNWRIVNKNGAEVCLAVKTATRATELQKLRNSIEIRKQSLKTHVLRFFVNVNFERIVLFDRKYY